MYGGGGGGRGELGIPGGKLTRKTALLAVGEARTAVKLSSPLASVFTLIVQKLCESRGGRLPGLSVLASLLVSVDVKLY